MATWAWGSVASAGLWALRIRSRGVREEADATREERTTCAKRSPEAVSGNWGSGKEVPHLESLGKRAGRAHQPRRAKQRRQQPPSSDPGSYHWPEKIRQTCNDTPGRWAARFEGERRSAVTTLPQACHEAPGAVPRPDCLFPGPASPGRAALEPVGRMPHLLQDTGASRSPSRLRLGRGEKPPRRKGVAAHRKIRESG